MLLRRLISVKDVAQFIGVNRFRVYEWVRNDEIPYLRTVRGIRFDPEQIQQWLRRHRDNSKMLNKHELVAE